MRASYNKLFVIIGVVLVVSLIGLLLVRLYQKESRSLHFEERIPGLGRSIEIELIELDPPIDSWRDEFLAPATSENVPWWVASLFWPLRLNEADLQRVYTQKYLSSNNELGPPPLQLEPPDIFARTTHAIRIKTDGVEYYFVGTLYSKSKEELGLWAEGLSTHSNVEGVWKIDNTPEWISRFPFGSREKMKELIESRTARLDGLNNLVPVQTGHVASE